MISASAPDNVWIFGQKGRAWRWNGYRWRATGWPYPYAAGAGRRRWLRAAVVSGDEAWVSGWDEGMLADGVPAEGVVRRAFLLHRDGGRWVEVPSPGDMILEEFSALSPREVWAIARVDDRDVNRFRMVRWNGSRWDEVPLPAPLAAGTVELSALTAVSSQEVWAVGYIRLPWKKPLSVVLRWDGRRWVMPAQPDGWIYLTAVASDGHGGIWVGADFLAGDPSVLHFDGSRWTYEVPPKTVPAATVFDLAHIPGTDRVVAAGSNPSYDEDAVGFIWTRR
ncbi:hypothetical protein J5X84_42985 [Streptosporangiaceae bacterium NEAU-GS5]|nr:hypothetical protein [Streptosporangiaceae bacterium NEAU-GS5]